MISEAKDTQAAESQAAGAAISYAAPISVVLPFYNQTQYLVQAVDSALAAAGDGLELVLINDGSTDKIGARRAIDQVLAKKRSGLNILVIETENRGLPSALNTGFAAASGEFLTWTSADNLFEPDALQLMQRFLIDRPLVDLVYADVRLIDSNGFDYRGDNYRSSDRDRSDRSRLRLPREPRALSAFPDNFINSCFMFRRRGYLSTGDHNPELVGLEDYDYWLRLSHLGRIEHYSNSGDDRPLYRYRLHAESMTETINCEDLAKRTTKRQTQAKTLADRLSSDLVVKLKTNRDELSSWQNLFSGTGIFVESAGGRLARFTENKITLLSCDRESGTLVEVGQGAPRIVGTEFPIDPIRQIAVGQKNGGQVYSVEAEGRRATAAALNPDPALLRSRDSSFGAITPTSGSLATAVVIVPDPQPGEQESLVRQLVGLCYSGVDNSSKCEAEPTPSLTVALVCSTPAGRQVADAVNRAVDDNSFLRILDLTAEVETADRSFVHSVVYILGSTDLIISPARVVTQGHDSTIAIDAEISLLADLALGAVSCRPVATVVPFFTEKPDLSASAPGKQNSRKLALTVYDAPQLLALESVSSLALYRALRASVGGPIWRPSRTGCDQWLELNSNIGAVRQIFAPLSRSQNG